MQLFLRRTAFRVQLHGLRCQLALQVGQLLAHGLRQGRLLLPLCFQSRYAGGALGQLGTLVPGDVQRLAPALGLHSGVLQLRQQTGTLGLQPAHALLGCGHVGVGCGLYLHLRLAACLGCDLLVLCNRLTAGACCTPEPTQTQRRQRQQGGSQQSHGIKAHDGCFHFYS